MPLIKSSTTKWTLDEPAAEISRLAMVGYNAENPGEDLVFPDFGEGEADSLVVVAKEGTEGAATDISGKRIYIKSTDEE